MKLIAIDLDDTLLNSNNNISARNISAIRRAVAAGIVVTIATGRMFCSAQALAAQLSLDVPLVTYNGALIKGALTEDVLFTQPVPSAIAAQVLTLFQHHQWFIQTYVDDVLYAPQRTERLAMYEQLAGVEAVVLGEKFFSWSQAPSKMLALAEPEQILKIEATLQEQFGQQLSLAQSKPSYLEITHPAVNKGAALAYLATHLNIERDQVMAIGDSFNDLSMLEFAGVGVAMGNAPAAIKARAQAVVATNDGDGVAEAIERFCIIDS